MSVTGNGIPGSNGQTGPSVIPDITLPVPNDVYNKGLEITRPLINQIEGMLRDLLARSTPQQRAELRRGGKINTNSYTIIYTYPIRIFRLVLSIMKKKDVDDFFALIS